jgi:ABC-type glutathione transport system ATPase component
MRTEAIARQAPESPLVRATGLSKSYVQRAPFSQKRFVIDALADVELEVAPASLTALIGESGSGKSTLARCLALLEKPDRGEIWFEGKEVSQTSSRELACLRPKIQMVFQDSAGALNPRFTAAEIIAEPLEIQQREEGRRLRSRACELMEEVGLSANWVDRRPLEFSGGQRQRLAIARAVLADPKILILDEATSNLDTESERLIQSGLSRLMQDRTCFVIAHRLSTIAHADRIVVLEDGREVESGTHAELMETDSRYRAMVQLQTSPQRDSLSVDELST